MKKSFLLEIGTEELPSSFCETGAKTLCNIITDFLKENKVNFEKSDYFYTPRRLTLLIEGLPEKQPDIEEEIVGPPKKIAFDEKGNPTQALLGFMKKYGIDEKNIKIVKKGNKEFVAGKVIRRGKNLKELFEENLPGLLKKLKFPKEMDWGKGITFARPVRWIVCLLDENIINFEFAGVKSGKISKGFRFAGDVEINHPSEYFEKLKKVGVIVNQEERKKKTLEQIEKICRENDLEWVRDVELLDEVVNLCEHPVCLLGKFDEKFLSLPCEVIIAALKEHQRYFALQKNGKLKNFFICVANVIEGNKGKIIDGHERVLKARLQDAEFYYQEDTKRPLSSYIDELKGMIWQTKLGNMFEKKERLKEIALYLQKFVGGDIEKIERASDLSKTDLLTNMIKDGKEFTKLAGFIGMEYARKSGEDEIVCKAIFEHYLPRFTGDLLPETKEGICLSLAERIDNLIGASLLSKLPTGAADPMGIRRGLTGLFTILIEKKISLSLKDIIKKAIEIYKRNFEKLFEKKKEENLFKFLSQRIEAFFVEKGYDIDLVRSMLIFDDIYGIYLRLEALTKLKDKKEFNDLLILARRVQNILEGYDEKEKPDPSLFIEKEEKELADAVNRIEKEFYDNVKNKEFDKATEKLLSIEKEIHSFFDNVLVMTEDMKLRLNRIRLLTQLSKMFCEIADFSKITPR